MADFQEKLITLLQQFGFSLNACKAYVSLLKKNPATGYEISAAKHHFLWRNDSLC